MYYNSSVVVYAVIQSTNHATAGRCNQHRVKKKKKKTSRSAGGNAPLMRETSKWFKHMMIIQALQLWWAEKHHRNLRRMGYNSRTLTTTLKSAYSRLTIVLLSRQKPIVRYCVLHSCVFACSLNKFWRDPGFEFDACMDVVIWFNFLNCFIHSFI